MFDYKESPCPRSWKDNCAESECKANGFQSYYSVPPCRATQNDNSAGSIYKEYPCSMYKSIMKNTYCLFQIKFITEYTNVQHIIITQI